MRESGKHDDVVIPHASKHLACKKNGIHLLYKPSVGRGQGRWWVGVVVGVGVDVDVGVDVVGVGVVGMVVGVCMVVVMVVVMVVGVGMGMGTWGKGNGGRKLGGGGERRSEEGFNVQCSKFNKVELWHVMLKPVTSREHMA